MEALYSDTQSPSDFKYERGAPPDAAEEESKVNPLEDQHQCMQGDLRELSSDQESKEAVAVLMTNKREPLPAAIRRAASDRLMARQAA